MVNQKTNLKNQKRAGFYWKEGKPYASVTQILSVIDKPALRYWFGREVYYAMIANPNLSEKEALAMPYQKSNEAIERGSAVHSVVEAFKNTKTKITGIPKKYKPYAEAFYTWADNVNANIVAQEKSIFCDEFQYGGTLDLLVQMPKEEHPFVVDVKTGKDIYTEAFMQTSAYQYALHENKILTSGIAVLLLTKEGSYKFQVLKNTQRVFEGFVATKKIWETLNEEMLIKIGYIK